MSCSPNGRAATVIVLVGVAAAMHVGKLPPAVVALQQSLGIGLLQAGFLLSLVQIGGMTLGLVAGLLAESFGLRRSMLTGLTLLTLAGFAGAWARDAGGLLALRAVESVGLLMTAVPAPSLLRRCVPPGRLTRVLGFWGAYMPMGMALALLMGPLIIQGLGWRAWWLLTALVTAACVPALWRWVPADGRPKSAAARSSWRQRLRATLQAPGPWLAALAFGVYALQWLALIGFLPTVYDQLGWRDVQVALATALVTAVNVVGNVAAGYALQRGVSARSLLWAGFAATGLGGSLAFGLGGAPIAARSLAGALLFSSAGGLIPGALFGLIPRLAPSDDTVATSVGWMQQWSAAGQVSGPPLVAWLAHGAGGWQLTWIVMAACSAVGCALAVGISRRVRSRQPVVA